MQNRRVLRNLVALSMTPGLGARRVHHLINDPNNLAKVFSFSKSELKSIEGIGEASALAILTFDQWNKVDQLIEATEKSGAQIITWADKCYPSRLKQIYDPPILFWMKGEPKALAENGVAVIGTRNPTLYGRKQAQFFTQALAEQGLSIISGLAYGIDSLAHITALKASGTTVAVLGSGIDTIYPKQNAHLADQIINSGGAVITEFPLRTPPDAGNFPLRNRIVSGLSLGVLVIESGMQGGSMITAELALDQNREIFAVPHAVTNISGSGCNYLIKRGAAKLVQSVEDILSELPTQYSATANALKHEETQRADWHTMDLPEIDQIICQCLEKGEVQVDDLADQLEISTSKLLVELLQLELQGLVKQSVGKRFELLK